MSFVDNPSCSACTFCSAGTDVPTETRRRTRRAMTAFFELELRGDTSAREWLAGVPMQLEAADGGVTFRTLNGF